MTDYNFPSRAICMNPEVHPAHHEPPAPACAGREVQFCEPCALGHSCPRHDPNPLDPYVIAQLPHQDRRWPCAGTIRGDENTSSWT